MDDIMINLMSKYLENCFPVTRLKSGKRFKRGVCIDGHTFFLPGANVPFKNKMYQSLKGCYAASDAEINTVISRFYNIN